MSAFTLEMEKARIEALQRLKDNATRLGANAVVGIDVETTEIFQGTVLVSATGTAAVLEPEQTRPFLDETLRAVGLDLAGSDKRTTGFCLLDEALHSNTSPLHTDREIISETISAKPDVVSIDAPLSLPTGRKSLSHRGPPHFRACDLELRRMKIKFFPITLGPMRKLTSRGMKLKKTLEARRLQVIESYPGSIQDILGMPRKQVGIEKLRRALADYGVKGDVHKTEITHDELDAITSALVGVMFLKGNYLGIGDPEEGLMILPKR